MQAKKSGKFLVGSLAIIGVLVFAVYLILNSMLSLADGVVAPPKMDAAAISERIAPVAQERVGEEPIVEASADNGQAEAVAASDDKGPGNQVFTAVCATCHVSGLLQAPRLGNKGDWAPRIEKGMETLYTHAINGFKNMPARGGRQDLSDEDVKAAVDYMVSQSE
ncbi:MAG: c-type cytochrome [Methylophaga sp.]|nr:c-type cytochrome [Methylophaga sp.]